MSEKEDLKSKQKDNSEILEPNSINSSDENELTEIISDDDLVNMYDDIVDMVKEDRKEVDEALANFTNMVMNEGDGSSASKEAIVNLLKMKLDSADKIAKIADLKTRIKLKERNTFPAYLAQNNTYNIGTSEKIDKRALLEKKQKENKK